MAKPTASKPAPSGHFSSVLAVIVVFASIFIGLVYQNDLVLWSPAIPETVYAIDHSRNITYVGTINTTTNVEHFRNIFYAEDTSGSNRFAPPVPFVPERGSIIDATREGAWCPQRTGNPPLPFTSPITNISENCLSVQISRPTVIADDAKLPVMVWLHGGGHALGSGSDVLYTPDGLIQLSVTNAQPIIFVAINYRFGIFGFASSKPLLAAKHTNLGLRDQRAAFDWVKQNIAVFGGDPYRVTAIGQSVGADDIGLHLTSYGGKKGVPFDRAIMMSGAPGQIFNGGTNFVANNTAAVASQVDCIRDGDAQSVATLQCLRDAPFELLTNKSVAMAQAARPPFGEAFFFPTHDGDYVPDYPSHLMRKGQFVKDIPLIAAWVTNEGAWYQPPTVNTDAEVGVSLTLWNQFLSNATISRLLELYPLSDFETSEAFPSAQYYRAAQMNRDIWFTCPVIDFTWQYAKHSSIGTSSEWSPRLYQFNATRLEPVYEHMGVPFWRVAHLSDIPYVLNIQDLPGGIDSSPKQLALASDTASMILKFVHGEHLETWSPAYTKNSVEDLKKDSPQSLELNVLGGLYGGAVADISGNREARNAREQAVVNEKLFARCALINSEQVRRETGV